MKSVLLLGATGQLGSLVSGKQPETVQLYPFSRESLDITNLEALQQVIEEKAPDVVINCAAYTAVDKAEKERTIAFRANSEAVANLARELPENTRLIHISTDFVFSMFSAHPYTPADPTAPVSVYGESKLGGERALLDYHGNNGVIIRTSWLYSALGKNFVTTMLQVMASRDKINVVNDQYGSPTSAHSLADVIWQFVFKEQAQGIYHWSDRGIITWYDFAVEIYGQARQLGLLKSDIHINPVPTEAYPTEAVRPAYSALDVSSTETFLGIRAEPWKEQLGRVLTSIKESTN